jgi:hypothetical protein
LPEVVLSEVVLPVLVQPVVGWPVADWVAKVSFAAVVAASAEVGFLEAVSLGRPVFYRASSPMMHG